MSEEVKIVKFRIIDWLLGVTFFLIPFYIIRYDLFGIPTNIFEFGVLLIFLVTLREIARNNQVAKDLKEYIAKFPKILLASILIFIISSFIGIWRAGFSSDSMGIVKSWVIIPIIFSFTVGYYLSDKKNNSKYLSAVNIGLFLSLMIVSLWAIFQRLGIIGTVLYQYGNASFIQYLGENFRAFGPFESPNYLAMFIVPILFLTIGTKLKGKSKKPKACSGAFYFSLILPLYALILTKSRAGIIALALSLSIIGAVALYYKLKTKVYRISLIVFCIILYSLFIILILKYGMRPDTDSMRFEIYNYSWQMIKQNPIWGVGLGNFQNYLSTMSISDSFRDVVLPYAYHPHNLYMALWLNNGIVGLVSFLVIVATSLWNIIKTKKSQNLIISLAVISLLLHGVFDTTYFKNDLSTIFWLSIISFYYYKTE